MSAPLPVANLDRGAPIHIGEFIAMTASLMAMAALGIDTMLPALPDIGNALGVTDVTDRQYVITIFGVGFGVAQLLHGPLTDRFGRRRLLLVVLALYAATNILAALAQSFPLLLVARFLGGSCVAGCRVATVAMVRDCFSGRSMARIMSLAFMVFMAVPVAAPALGAGILLFGDWRTIFWIIAGAALLLAGWIAIRLPETQHTEDRRPIEPGPILAGWRIALTDRLSLGYSLAAAALTGALYGYLGTIEPIMAETFGSPQLLIVVFATTAATMAVANLANSRLVMRLGMRRLGHGAVAALVVISLAHLALVLSGRETLWTFGIAQALTLACFALSTSNFSSLAMERMGHIAGTASSVQGFLAITIGSGLGMVVGQSFDGTTAPLTIAFLLAGLAALLAAGLTERGRLFHPA